MQPYALGHRVLLHHYGNAFVGGRFPLYEDLILAAFLCSNTWEENQTLLRSPFRRWLRLKIWGKLAGNFNIPRAILAMHQHVIKSDVFPEQGDPGEGVTQKQLGSANSARLYLFLRTFLNKSEAMNMPLILANQLHASALEEAGKITLMPPARKALLDRLQAQNQEAS